MDTSDKTTKQTNTNDIIAITQDQRGSDIAYLTMYGPHRTEKSFAALPK